MAFIKNRFDMFFHFNSAFVVSCYLFSAEDVIIKGAARNAKSFAKRMDTILTI